MTGVTQEIASRRFEVNADPKRQLEMKVEAIALTFESIPDMARLPETVFNEAALDSIHNFLFEELARCVNNARMALQSRPGARGRFSLTPAEDPAVPPVKPVVPRQRQKVFTKPPAEPEPTSAKPVFLGRLAGHKDNPTPVYGAPERVKRVKEKASELPHPKHGGIEDAGFLDE